MFVAYLTNALMWRYAPQDMFELPVGFANGLSCVLSCRLLLNIRGIHSRMKQQTPPTEAAFPTPAVSGHTYPPRPSAALTTWSANPTELRVHTPRLFTTPETVLVHSDSDDGASTKGVPLGGSGLPDIFSSRYASDVEMHAVDPLNPSESRQRDLTKPF